MLTQPNEKIYYPRQKQRHRQTWLSVVEGGPLERGSRGRRASRGPRMKLFFSVKESASREGHVTSSRGNHW